MSIYREESGSNGLTREFECDYDMRISIYKLEKCGSINELSEISNLRILLGPHSKNLLFKKYFFRYIDNLCRGNCVIIPSSYDDVAVYRILEREYNLKILWRNYWINDLLIINSPHKNYATHLNNNIAKRIVVFIEAHPKFLKNLSQTHIYGSLINKLIVYHGVWGSPGIYIDDLLKISASLNYDHFILIDYEKNIVSLKSCLDEKIFNMKLNLS